MNAILHPRYGPPDVLELGEIEPPVPGPGEVLVRVRAASPHRGDWHVVAGLPYLVRVAGFGLLRPKHRVPGMDLAGEVLAVGADVREWSPGDAVFGWGMGAFAEQVAVPAEQLVHKPANVSFEQAASTVTSAITALHAVRAQARVRAGQRVLVNGAAGGVGSFAVQLARDAGAEVTAVCSAGGAELARRAGAAHVIDYAREDFAGGARRWHALVDCVANRSLGALRGALELGGGHARGKLVVTP